VKHTRHRTDRRKEYRHHGAEGNRRPRVVRLDRDASGEVVLHLYVHSDHTVTEGGGSSSGRQPETANVLQRPTFSGSLFNWEDHYRPIAKRMAPKLAEEEQRGRRALLTRLGRFGFLAVLLTALMAVGCDWW
jgi:hypothetical protein